MDVRAGGSIVRIVPELSVRRGRAAIEFYKAAFGAVEDHRVGGTDEAEDVVAQLSVGDATFWVSDESPPHQNFSPESLGGGTVRILLIVDDPDAVVRQAVAAGAIEVYPVSEEHGWRLGRIEDPFGHHWEVGKPLIDWPPSSSGRELEAKVALFEQLDNDVFNQRDFDLFDRIHDPDVVIVFPDGRRTRGIEQHREDIEALFAWSPDMRVVGHPIRFGSGEWTLLTSDVEGTFSQPMQLADGSSIPPTGRRYSYTLATIARWKGELIVEEHLFWDNAAVMEQIGLGPKS